MFYFKLIALVVMLCLLGGCVDVEAQTAIKTQQKEIAELNMNVQELETEKRVLEENIVFYKNEKKLFDKEKEFFKKDTQELVESLWKASVYCGGVSLFGSGGDFDYSEYVNGCEYYYYLVLDEEYDSFLLELEDF